MMLLKRSTSTVVAALLACGLIAQEVSQSGLELKAPRPLVSQAERAPHAMVASAHELASQAGIEVLKSGGNAVDAAVAIAFALAVVHPEAGNLGGGGYLLIRMADGRARAIDYRETAPAAAHPGMFKDARASRVGYEASAVPGTVAGMAMAHGMFGASSWKHVLEPARRLAKNGFPASQRIELILPLQVPIMSKFPETARILLHGSMRPLRQGEILKQADLARTIGRLQKHGWREFYEGETARLIARDMSEHNGTITFEDLKNYKPLSLEPLRGTYRGHTVLTVPPSTSGGIALLEMLNILEQFPMRLGMEGSTVVRHLQIEAMKRSHRDRTLHVADPAFVTVPVAKLISKEYAAELAKSIRLDRASKQPATSSADAVESDDTTHFSVIDSAGNVVTNTYTLNGFYGSQVIGKGTGVLLNDIMSAFSTSAKSKNAVAPGKRPLSSMAPAIVLRPDGGPWFALGSPGALTIANTVLQVTMNVIDFKMALRDAVEYPRIHQQSSPDHVEAEPAALVFDVAERLKAMGHTLNPKLRSQGDVHAVMFESGLDGWRLGWSDGRRGGKAIGY